MLENIAADFDFTKFFCLCATNSTSLNINENPIYFLTPGQSVALTLALSPALAQS